MDINSLDRFIKAQELAYPIALREIQNGKKRSHWMCYIFPQLRELGTSSMARYYGISDLGEAKAYLNHPVLGERLYESAEILLEHKDKYASGILGDIDALKLKSCMTLFALASEDYTIFDEVIRCFFDGEMDEVTIGLINSQKFVIRKSTLIKYQGDDETVIIPDGVVKIGFQAFRGCKKIKKVICPQSLERIGKYAFAECENLHLITIPNVNTQLEDGAFKGCSALKDDNGFVIVNDVVFDYYKNESTVIIPAGVTEISAFSFDKRSYITNVVFPDTVKTIEGHAFYNCTNINTLTLPHSVSDIHDRAFKGCKGLADKNGFVIINNILFDYLGDSTSITIPDGIVRIENYAFGSNSSLVRVIIPSSVTSIGKWAFIDCKKLKDVTLSNGLLEIDICAFQGCESLETIIIPNSVKSIGKKAFSNCINIKNITISDNTSIGAATFLGCKALSNRNGYVIVRNILYDYLGKGVRVNIPTTVTGVSDSAFEDWQDLTVSIPESVMHIDFGAFVCCDNLTIRASSGSYAEEYAKKHNYSLDLI